MGLSNLFKKNPAPEKPKPATGEIYELLFCDDLSRYRDLTTAPGEYPWNLLFEDSPDVAALQKVVADEEVGSRIRVLAYRLLDQLGHKVTAKDLQAVIIEVGLGNGLDVLASYRDGTARYINHSGKMIVWETEDDKSKAFTDSIFQHAGLVIKTIGPWDKARRPPPKTGNARVTFLVSGELYFGEAPVNMLFSDDRAGPVFSAGTALMQHLMEKQFKGN